MNCFKYLTVSAHSNLPNFVSYEQLNKLEVFTMDIVTQQNIDRIKEAISKIERELDELDTALTLNGKLTDTQQQVFNTYELVLNNINNVVVMYNL